MRNGTKYPAKRPKASRKARVIGQNRTKRSATRGRTRTPRG